MSTTPLAATPSAWPRRCIDADQVGAKYRMSRRQVFRAADALMIPPGFKVGRLRRWDETEVDQHIAAGCPPLRRGGRRP
jgi:predicted DNA-binding transcriptional regulator AlpA